MSKTLKTVTRKKNTMKDHSYEDNKKTSLDKYIDDFNQKCIQKIKSMKLDKHGLEKEYVNNFRFKTRNSNDIKYNLLVKAEEIINRQDAIKKLMKYVKFEHIAYQIEKGLYEFSLIHVTINNIQDHYVENVYLDKLHDLCSNLDINDEYVCNETLIHTVLNGKFNPYFLAFLSPEQLHPKRWADVIQKKQIREDTANNLQTTDIYKCAKCGERKFKITELQIRCADEPMARFVTCMVCYNTFIK